MLPIIFINLDSDQKRRQRMEGEFARLGLDGRRFDATRWTALPADEQARFYSPELNARQFHKPLVNGEKGCYASHLRCWQMLLDSDAPALVVLEDDIRLKDEFAQVIQAIEALPAGWDMIKLIGRSDLGKREKLRAQAPLCPGFSLVDYRRIPSLTAGYVVSRSGAAKLLTQRLPFGRPVDVDLRYWWENRLQVRGIMPAAIRLDESSEQSSIGQKAGEGSLAIKWHKFCLKAAYSWHSWRQR